MKIIYKTEEHTVHPLKDVEACCESFDRFVDNYDIKSRFEPYYMKSARPEPGIRIKIKNDDGSFEEEFRFEYCPFCGARVQIEVLAEER